MQAIFGGDGLLEYLKKHGAQDLDYSLRKAKSGNTT